MSLATPSSQKRRAYDEKSDTVQLMSSDMFDLHTPEEKPRNEATPKRKKRYGLANKASPPSSSRTSAKKERQEDMFEQIRKRNVERTGVTFDRRKAMDWKDQKNSFNFDSSDKDSVEERLKSQKESKYSMHRRRGLQLSDPAQRRYTPLRLQTAKAGSAKKINTPGSSLLRTSPNYQDPGPALEEKPSVSVNQSAFANNLLKSSNKAKSVRAHSSVRLTPSTIKATPMKPFVPPKRKTPNFTIKQSSPKPKQSPKQQVAKAEQEAIVLYDSEEDESAEKEPKSNVNVVSRKSLPVEEFAMDSRRIYFGRKHFCGNMVVTSKDLQFNIAETTGLEEQFHVMIQYSDIMELHLYEYQTNKRLIADKVTASFLAVKLDPKALRSTELKSPSTYYNPNGSEEKQYVVFIFEKGVQLGELKALKAKLNGSSKTRGHGIRVNEVSQIQSIKFVKGIQFSQKKIKDPDNEDFISRSKAVRSPDTSSHRVLRPRITKEKPAAIDEDLLPPRTRRGRAMSRADDSDLFLSYPLPPATKDIINLTKGDIRRLKPFQYLNDNLIDFYLRWLFLEKFHPLGEQFCSKFGVVNSHFYSRYTEDIISNSCFESNVEAGYRKVERWTLKTRIFEREVVMIPINKDLHWSLAIVCNPAGASEGPDTMVQYHRIARRVRLEIHLILGLTVSHMYCVVRFFGELSPKEAFAQVLEKLEWENKRSKGAEYDEDAIVLVRPKIPTQSNGSDCGVFMLQYAEHFIQNYQPIPRADMKDNLSSIFHEGIFDNAAIDDKRLAIMKLLGQLRIKFTNSIEERSDGKKSGCNDNMEPSEDLPCATPRQSKQISKSNQAESAQGHPECPIPPTSSGSGLEPDPLGSRPSGFEHFLVKRIESSEHKQRKLHDLLEDFNHEQARDLAPLSRESALVECEKSVNSLGLVYDPETDVLAFPPADTIGS